MRIAILGRTKLLLAALRALQAAGHEVVLIGTRKPAEHCDVGEEDFRNIANELGASYLPHGDINGDECVHALVASGAEIGVSVNWPTVIGARPIQALPLGILNAHAGDLPRYRGNACPNWAILNGEQEVGLCVHQMDAGELDSGPVVVRDYLPLGDTTYIGDVYDWLAHRIPVLFVQAVQGLEDGLIIPQPQPTNSLLSLRCYPRRPQDSRIDWQQPAEQIYRLIRASAEPFSGAYTFLEGTQKVTIWRAQLFEHLGPFCAVPGQVLLREEGGPVIACGTGALRLARIEMDGSDHAYAAATVAKSLRNRVW